MRIAVLALDDVFDTGLSSLLDTFAIANELSPAPPLDVSIVSLRRPIRTHLGFLVAGLAPPRRAPDLVIVPALAAKQPETIAAALARPDVVEAARLIAAWHARGSRVAAACTGTFVLGRSGTLDRRRATTSWWLGPAFRKAFPTVELDESEMLVRDGPVLTAGAALAHVDLALAILREGSPDLAATVARYLLIDDRPSQASYIAPAHLLHDDEIVKAFERWVRRNLRAPFEVKRAAHAIGSSERTLQRRIRAVLGKPPIMFVQDLRIERAVHLLRMSRASVDDIAAKVGYGNGSTLRTLLRRRLNTTVGAIRGRSPN
ncbi:MAG TPA: helix-turn-helix domain-containing protein [Kofleriaceae bacterium]|jgi:transcriptional regulator GlxA family with amidase domain